MSTVYTIGHSTRSPSEFLAALSAHGIKTLIDIRAFPASRRFPHFNRESLEQMLPASGIAYFWEKRLGGRRKKTRENSPHAALRNDSFRHYADYMMTQEFKSGMREVLERAEKTPTTIMCAERVYFHCHRMLVSDWLVLHGHEVLHIDDIQPARPHRPLPEARLQGEDIIYNGGLLF